jgi:predicted dehydrogenase
MTRRNFVKTSAFAAGILFIPNARRVFGANERVSVGIIGPGQQGRALMNEFRTLEKELNVEMTTVCDIWRLNRERGAAMVAEWHEGKQPRQCRSIDEVCSLKDVDAIIVATVDFQHARHLAQAVRSSKDVYCENPMANDLREASDALRAVKETKRVVQIGAQRRSDGRYAAAAQKMQSGVLGTISKIDISWNDIQQSWRRSDVNEAKAEDVDWQRFLMDKPARPFNPHQFMEWRLYRDFSSGIPDQWMSHLIDVVHWFTGDAYPKSVVAQGSISVWKDGRENPDTFQALLEYPKGYLVSYSTTLGNARGKEGVVFHGTNGSFDTRQMKFTGEGGGGDEQIREEVVVQSTQPNDSHLCNWLECVRNRKTPNAPPESVFGSVVAVAMAVRSMNTGRRVDFDSVRPEITGTPTVTASGRGVLTKMNAPLPDVVAVQGKTDLH